MLLNHVARESLNWRTPTEWLLDYTPDITAFLVFVFLGRSLLQGSGVSVREHP